MTAERRLLVFGSALAVLLALLALLQNVLMPFVAGTAVAYFLDPLADRLEKRKVSRTAAAGVIVGGFLVAVLVLLVLLVPLLQAQVAAFVARVPTYVETARGVAMPLLERLWTSLDEDQAARLRAAAGGLSGEAVRWLGEVLRRLVSGGAAVLDILSLLVITPLVAFYLLRDWDALVGRIDGWLPRDAAPTIRGLARDIDGMMSGFVRGQATVCLVLGIFYGIGLSLVGLDFGLLVGLVTGLISFVPYFGMAVGLLTTLVLAFVQSMDGLHFVLLALVFALGQVMEGFFLTPRLVGERIGLHPVWVIFALLAGGAVFGFTGVLLAVPMAAVIGVLARFGLARYQESPLYLGDGGGS